MRRSEEPARHHASLALALYAQPGPKLGVLSQTYAP